MDRRFLYYSAAAFWGIPGMIITVKGIKAYLAMPSHKLWWLLLITAFVVVGFLIMFRKIVDKYSARIAAQPQKTAFGQTFPLRGWILIVCMSCLGIALRFIPGIRKNFITGTKIRLFCQRHADNSTTLSRVSRFPSLQPRRPMTHIRDVTTARTLFI